MNIYLYACIYVWIYIYTYIWLKAISKMTAWHNCYYIYIYYIWIYIYMHAYIYEYIFIHIYDSRRYQRWLRGITAIEVRALMYIRMTHVDIKHDCFTQVSSVDHALMICIFDLRVVSNLIIFKRNNVDSCQRGMSHVVRSRLKNSRVTH